GFRKLPHEGVFFENGGIGPPSWAVEFHDQWRPIVHADPVNTIFVAMEREQAAVTAEPCTVQCVHDAIGCQGREGMGGCEDIHKLHFTDWVCRLCKKAR